MDTIQKAYTLLCATESSLRDLIKAAVAESRYSEVAQLAKIAELLGKAISHSTSDEERHHMERQGIRTDELQLNATESVVKSTELLKTESLKKSVKRSKTDEFPKFETDGNRLIKTGWSKKARTTYEHRVERDIALSVSIYLASIPDRGVFKMEDMLPIELADGSGVPSYQAYLVLAWLRNLGLIERRGKDGYQWAADSFDDTKFDIAWKSTPSRAQTSISN